MCDFLTFWVVFNRPRDFPEHYVVRRQFIKRRVTDIIPSELAPKGTIQSPDSPIIAIDRIAFLYHDVNTARKDLRQKGLVCMPRKIDDDIKIVETWLTREWALVFYAFQGLYDPVF